MNHDEFNVELYLTDVQAKNVVLDNEAAVRDRARSGDKAARRTLIESYLSITADLGLRLAPEGTDRLRALQEANLVLMRQVAAGEPLAVTLGPAIARHFDEVI